MPSVRKHLAYLELCLGMDQTPNNSLWTKISSQTLFGLVVVGIYYRHCDQEENADETLFQLEEVSHVQVLFLMGD